jgi:flagellar biosynthesis protein FlhB
VAKGVDDVAMRIRDMAKEHKVPIMRNPPLARGLYATCDIDDMVPAEHFRAVAEIISYVFRMKGRKLG